ncbi:MAG: PaaI family thioesterase [Ilumatobacteraceae bacterium]
MTDLDAIPDATPDDLAAAQELLDATRDLADHVWRTNLPAAERAELAAEIRALIDRLLPIETAAPVRTELGVQLPGRGSPLLPPMVRRATDGAEIGRVTFTSAHVGAGTAVHGGWLAIVFDEMLGGVAHAAALSRTAWLRLDYRGLTPIGTELVIEGHVDRIEGRKIFVKGRLLDGDRLCAEAEALFVAVQEWA